MISIVLTHILDKLESLAKYTGNPKNAAEDLRDSMHRSEGTIILCDLLKELIGKLGSSVTEISIVVARLKSISSTFFSANLKHEASTVSSLIKHLDPSFAAARAGPAK